MSAINIFMPGSQCVWKYHDIQRCIPKHKEMVRKVSLLHVFAYSNVRSQPSFKKRNKKIIIIKAARRLKPGAHHKASVDERSEKVWIWSQWLWLPLLLFFLMNLFMYYCMHPLLWLSCAGASPLPTRTASTVVLPVAWTTAGKQDPLTGNQWRRFIVRLPSVLFSLQLLKNEWQ